MLQTLIGRKGIVLVREGDRRITSVIERALTQEGAGAVVSLEPAAQAGRLSLAGVVLLIADFVQDEPGAGDLVALARAQAIPTVLMSADAATILAHADSGLPLLRKPFSIHDLLAAVVDALRAPSRHDHHAGGTSL